MTPKLIYFDIIGYAESIRYMLHYAEVDFEDVRHNPEEWPIKEVKDSLPYGQLPIYEEDGRVINQSIAIARYVASQVGLLPSDPWEQAKLDAVVLTIYDFFNKLFSIDDKEDPDKKKTQQEEFVDFFFSRFEKELDASNGHFSEQLSWADFVLAATVSMINEHTKSSVEKDYPTIGSLVSEIISLPGVEKYLANKQSSD